MSKERQYIPEQVLADFYEAPAKAISNWYEQEIVAGRLKVVKQVEVHHPRVPEEEWRECYSDPMRLKDDSFGMLVTKCCSRNPHFNANRRHKYFGIPPLTWGCPECGLTVNLDQFEDGK